MITGPNMSGKSAILRQTALVTILAKLGALFRKTMKFSIVDRIFTRVGLVIIYPWENQHLWLR
ncbi:MAG: hypothetical protein CM15mP102_00740 [Flavobacteriales bacterium]|nr:MAG: hypothetical protein CM15mP102_00740 [Flavobacteriales bacterium]